MRSHFTREALLKINCDGGGAEGDCQHDAKAAGGLRHNAEKHGDEMEAILGLAGERREEFAKFVKKKRITTQGLRFVTVEVCFFLQSHSVRPDYCIFYADPGQRRAASWVLNHMDVQEISKKKGSKKAPMSINSDDYFNSADSNYNRRQLLNRSKCSRMVGCCPSPRVCEA